MNIKIAHLMTDISCIIISKSRVMTSNPFDAECHIRLIWHLFPSVKIDLTPHIDTSWHAMWNIHVICTAGVVKKSIIIYNSWLVGYSNRVLVVRKTVESHLLWRHLDNSTMLVTILWCSPMLGVNKISIYIYLICNYDSVWCFRYVHSIMHYLFF